MLFQLASIAFLLGVARSQGEDLIEKDCEYAIDVYLFALTDGEIAQYTTAERCSYIDLETEDGDTTVSWEYMCENNGDMSIAVYWGATNCVEGSGVNMTEWVMFEADESDGGNTFMCGGLSNCAVKMTVREPCTGNSDLAADLWPTKDICIGGANGSAFYSCDGDTYMGTFRDNSDCSGMYSLSFEAAIYEDGCEDDTDLDVKCNSAHRFSFSLFALASLFFAFMR